MIDEELCGALNGQVNAELYSGYLYFAMASHFEATNLKGFANWMRVQAQEEMAHAVKLHDYVLVRDGKMTFSPVEAPPSSWASQLAVFEFDHCHEITVTRAINDLVDRATAAKDHATAPFLQWYVSEQVEEEATFKELVDQLKLAGDAGGALLMLDRELAARKFVPAVDPAAG